MPRRSQKLEDLTRKPVGGFFFLATLVCLLIICPINLAKLAQLWDSYARSNWKYFGAGAVLGGWTTAALLVGRFGIFLHEFKHALVSHFAGNRERGIKVREDSGEFRYSYTRDTEKFNALIVLAPYWLPLITIPTLAILLLPIWSLDHRAVLVIAGGVWAADLIMNLRDVSRHQSDLVRVRGGYGVALLFVAAMNTAIFSYLAAWVSQGWYGIKCQIHALGTFVVQLVVYYRGTFLEGAG